jgi:hypothetical protein
MTPKPMQSIKIVTKINPRAGVRDEVKAYYFNAINPK